MTHADWGVYETIPLIPKYAVIFNSFGFICVYACSACMNLCIKHVCIVPEEIRRGRQIPGISYGWL